MNQLDQLKQLTVVVADTGNFLQIAQYAPRDATTNPSLILKAVQRADYAPLVSNTVAANKSEPLSDIVDQMLVRFGLEILKIVPGRVSTEVDARLSFDTKATVTRARRIIDLYEIAGIDRDRVLIKIVSTWEGIAAARRLESEGIHCNLTLLFGLPQAVACGDGGITLISPFVGRIYDWYKKSAGPKWNEADQSGVNDPGVQSVTTIFNYFKHFGIVTEVMGASFRNAGQIRALAGCDLLTISPDLLGYLQADNTPLSRTLNADEACTLPLVRMHFDEPAFRFAMNEDAMATEKLAEGIRSFVADSVALDTLIEGAQ